MTHDSHTLTFPHYDGFIELGCSRRLQQAMQLWEMAIRFTLNLLIITILVGLVGVVVKTFMDLRLLLSADLEVPAHTRHHGAEVIVDTWTYAPLPGSCKITGL